ncbi:MAG: hypothetical protein VCA18_11515, partial [Opitutales bacterium]
MKNYLIGFSLLLFATYLYVEQAKVQQENAEENQLHDKSLRQEQVDGNYTTPIITDVADGGMQSDVNATPLSTKIPQEVKTYEGLVGDKIGRAH